MQDPLPHRKAQVQGFACGKKQRAVLSPILENLEVLGPRSSPLSSPLGPALEGHFAPLSAWVWGSGSLPVRAQVQVLKSGANMGHPNAQALLSQDGPGCHCRWRQMASHLGTAARQGQQPSGDSLCGGERTPTPTAWTHQVDSWVKSS